MASIPMWYPKPFIKKESGWHFRVWEVMNYLRDIPFSKLYQTAAEKMDLENTGFLEKWYVGLLGRGEKKDRMRQIAWLHSPAIEYSYPILRQLLSPAALKELTSLNESERRDSGKSVDFKKACFHQTSFLQPGYGGGIPGLYTANTY